MLDLLKNREDLQVLLMTESAKCKDSGYMVHISYIPRYDKFKSSDWFDDATIYHIDMRGVIHEAI